MKAFGMILAVPLLLGSGASAGTVRHLTYGYATYPSNIGKAPVTNFTGPGTGRMDVDVLGTAKDGGAIVQMREWAWNAVRPDQQLQCEVYDDGVVACPLIPPVSDVESALLPLLAQDFYQSDSQWQRHFAIPCGAYSVRCTSDVTYNVTKTNDDIATITSQGALVKSDAKELAIHWQDTIDYNRASSIPMRVHYETTPPERDDAFRYHTYYRSVDLQLLTDSAGAR